MASSSSSDMFTATNSNTNATNAYVTENLFLKTLTVTNVKLNDHNYLLWTQLFKYLLMLKEKLSIYLMIQKWRESFLFKLAC